MKKLLTCLLYFLIAIKGYSQWTGSPDQGTLVHSLHTASKYPITIPSGDGGSIIAFINYQDHYEGNDFYQETFFCLQKINSDGSLAWGTTEKPVIVDSGKFGYSGEEPQVQIEPDGHGGVFAMWLGVRSYADVYLQHIDSAGTLLWAPGGQLVTDNPDKEQWPTLSVSACKNGSVIAGWNAKDNVGRMQLYAQKFSTAGVTQWLAQGVKVNNGSGERDGMLVSDGDNGIIAFCNDRLAGNILALRLDSNGQHLWQQGGVSVCSAKGPRSVGYFGSRRINTKAVVADNKGGAIVVFQDSRNSQTDSDYNQEANYDLFAQRIDKNGTLQWAAAGKPVSTLAENQYVNKIIFDSLHGSTILYEDYGLHGPHLQRLQKLSSEGQMLWGDAGIVLTPANYDFYSDMTTDGNGNTVVANQVTSLIFEDTIRAHKYNAAGIVQWPGGLVVSNSFSLRPPAITANADGSAIVVWAEYAGNSIRASKVLANGTLAYTVPTFFTIANGNWNNPAIWAGGTVPTAGANIIIKNTVTINVNVNCSSLKIESPGFVKANPGVMVNVLK